MADDADLRVRELHVQCLEHVAAVQRFAVQRQVPGLARLGRDCDAREVRVVLGGAVDRHALCLGCRLAEGVESFGLIDERVFGVGIDERLVDLGRFGCGHVAEQG